ncbi:MAG TPA: gamma carbonic anhydrase family protein [Roseiflexaceae bacterium]|nr:gamma carbonic anhydrase family protein [Roseiflexaceae bacterium]HMP41917.1 gamma carbonic anhydrase family protein [Roseiflexaceae bacterium]
MHQETFPDPTNRLEIHPSAYISPHAIVSGSVTIGADSSVWPMVVIRGDNSRIRIGERCNIQDGTILHADPDAFLTIGDEVSIGHAAVVHGCTVEPQVLIGIGAVVLNHAHIGSGSLIAARALVTEGMQIPPASLVVGIPAMIKPLSPAHRERIARTVRSYLRLKELYRNNKT